ncbi:MAG: AmmeMemoRadiSam system protein A [Desulfobulbus sp.]|nr:AmmeMemoRadiSam system protein A [Desulfobulbus sp.]
MITHEQGQLLIRLARQQIETHLGIPPTSPVSQKELTDPALQQKRGVFITLHKHGALRGCIGSLTAVEPVIQGVQRNALNAAFHDHRFTALTVDELPDLQIEVSVLTTPEPLTYNDVNELVRRLRPDIDGVILKSPDGASATFLPQVWQQLPDAAIFLDHLCRKAGLAADAWRSGQLSVFTYQVQSFA